ncbi:RsmB/NOP family class I SAM-dependent RNA methyltransferase, partial [Dietzia sp. UBA5065]|uniref:RsmB/NOP family class I SAM-dependent RNA methyltransferase n=1 Tax=Dietzia sp. UBA5065 TaxID=1946422 RepID=UPI0025BBB938
LLAADDARPKVHLAARPGEISAEELALITGGTEGTLSPYAVHLDSGDPGTMEPVKDRLATVQDEGSQVVAVAMSRAPLVGEDGGRWLDLCAGPGGKAVMLGALAESEGATVTGIEISEHRTDLVRAATKGLPVKVHTADGRDPGLEPGFDRVLVDAPCSGLGALRRRPEARWRKTAADIQGLVVLQRALLDSALRLVRPGGVVLYATCSPHLSETVSVIREAARRPDVELLDVREFLTGADGTPIEDLGDGPWVQLWPHRHGTDAMFMAALRRSDDA